MIWNLSIAAKAKYPCKDITEMLFLKMKDIGSRSGTISTDDRFASLANKQG
jgi:hypothetical protein